MKTAFQNVSRNFAGACRRFPISVALLAIAVFFAIICFHAPKLYSANFYFFAIYYPASAAVLALSLRLWSEEVSNRRLSLIVQGVVHAVWLGAALYFASQVPFYDNKPTTIALVACCVAILLSCWVLSYVRCSTDDQLWNFMWRTTISAVISWGVGLALYLALSILLGALKLLFGLDTSIAIFDVLVACEGLVAPFLLMQLIPAGSKKHDSGNHLSRFVMGVTKYMLIPVAALYLLTLYVYTLKIIIEWRLPDGGVSYLVTALMAVMLLLTFVLYPSRNDAGMKLGHWIVRWLPVMVLPMLVLMSIGIARRVIDYGITISRLYLVLFNVWCYVVCVVLFVIRSKRFGWIISSFALVFLISSIGPWSMSNITRHVISHQIDSTLAVHGVKKTPMDAAGFSKFINKLDSAQAENLCSQLDYLRLNYDSTAIAPYVDPRVQIYESDTWDTDTVAVPASTQDIDVSFPTYEPIAVPAGYRRVTYVDADVNADVVVKNGDILNFAIDNGGKMLHFTVSTGRLRQAKANKSQRIELKSSEGAMLYPYQFYFDPQGYNGSARFMVKGLLFLK